MRVFYIRGGSMIWLRIQRVEIQNKKMVEVVNGVREKKQ